MYKNVILLAFMSTPIFCAAMFSEKLVKLGKQALFFVLKILLYCYEIFY